MNPAKIIEVKKSDRKTAKGNPIYNVTLEIAGVREVHTCFDSAIENMAGQELQEYESKAGQYGKILNLPKKQGGGGQGQWAGRSESYAKELEFKKEAEILRVRSMAVAYAKDLVVADKTELGNMFPLARRVIEFITEARTEVQTEPKPTLTPSTPPKAPPVPSQTCTEATGADTRTVKEKLIDELRDYSTDGYSGVDEQLFEDTLKEITKFEGNSGTSNIDKVSEKWAGSALKKLREKVNAQRATQTPPQEATDIEPF